MEKDITVTKTVKVGCDKNGNIKIVEGPDSLPKDVVEELLNMVAEVTIKNLVEGNVKGITEETITNMINVENNKELKIWRFVSYASLAVIIILIIKLKGLI